MEFLLAKNEDKEQVKQLWKYCFTDTDDYINYYFEKRYDIKNNYIVKKDDEIKCSLMANDYNISINNTVLKAPYIVGVSSNALDRGSGYASYLIKETLKNLNTDFAMLMPIDTNIYTRYGFANIYDMLEMDIPLDRIKDCKNNLVLSEKYKIQDLIYVYKKVSKNIGIYFERDEEYYKKFIDEVILENGHIFLCYNGDKPVGYMVFYPKHIIGETGFVREIFTTNIFAYEKLVSALKYHFTQMKNIILHTYCNSDIFFYFQADNKISYKLKPFMMSRVLNVENAIKYMNIKSDIKIKIVDDIINKNNIVFDFETMNITDEKEDLTIDIYNFTKLYFGYMSAREFIFQKCINLGDETIKKLDNIFEKKQCYFNDYV